MNTISLNIKSLNNIKTSNYEYGKNYSILKPAFTSNKAGLSVMSLNNISAMGINIKQISFTGLEFKSIQDVPTIDSAIIDNIVEDAKKAGKQIVIMTDYDGTFSDFAGARQPIPVAQPSGGKEAFNNMLETAKEANLPFIIVTKRFFNELPTEEILGPQITNNVNVVCLNGNQMKIKLPKNERTDLFIQQWQQKEDYKTTVSDLGDQLLVEINPISLKSFQAVKKECDKELTPLGFELKDVSVFQYLKWRKLAKDVQDSKEETYKINVSDDVLQSIKSWKSLTTSSADSSKAQKDIVIKSEKDQICLKYNQLIDYGVQKFKQICQKNIGSELTTKSWETLSLTEKEIKKAQIKDCSDKQFCELVDFRTKLTDKGTSVESLTGLLGGSEEIYPIFLGDRMSQGADDEAGIEKARALGGIGIGIVSRSTKEDVAERLNLTTTANYKLESFTDSMPFVMSLAERVKNN